LNNVRTYLALIFEPKNVKFYGIVSEICHGQAPKPSNIQYFWTFPFFELAIFFGFDPHYGPKNAF
jgi:hypothetical protein